jgi:5-formyltetrahydrofolate cyclo-ligase
MKNSFNSKAEARAHFSALRSSIDVNIRKEKSLNICRKILSLPEIEECDVLFLYAPIKSEPDPSSLLEIANNKGIKVSFPISIKDNNTLDFRIINTLCDLEIGSYGIREPKSNSKKAIFTQKSICIVPALAFDSNGNRLGYGKGFYDRFLNEFTGISIGITFSELKCDLLPTENTDIPVDIIITDKESVRIK